MSPTQSMGQLQENDGNKRHRGKLCCAGNRAAESRSPYYVGQYPEHEQQYPCTPCYVQDREQNTVQLVDLLQVVSSALNE